jgi:hypothetical protein
LDNIGKMDKFLESTTYQWSSRRARKTAQTNIKKETEVVISNIST